MVYVSEKRREQLATECLDELYLNATPPISIGFIKFLYEKELDTVAYWKKHKITEQKYNEIVAKYEKLLGSQNKQALAMFLFNYAPTIIYEDDKK